MKNKFLFSILSILGIASILGLSLIPKEKVKLSTTQNISLASTTNTSNKVITKEDLPLQNWIKTAQIGDNITFNYFVYTCEETRVTVTCSDPAAVETLYLYHNLQKDETTNVSLYYSNINFAQFTNVKKVVILNNDPFYCFRARIKQIPNPYDLYINGYVDSLENHNNIKELYICEVYDTNKNDITASSDSHKLATTHITKVHYADWNQPWTSVNRFSNEEIQNADGVSIKIDFLTEEEIGFSEDVFYPYEDFIPRKEYFGGTAYPYYEGVKTSLASSDMTYLIEEISSKVKTFILPEDVNLSYKGIFKMDSLIIDNKRFNFTSLLNSSINTLVLRTHTDNFSFTSITKAKDIWFAPTETPPTITNVGYNETTNSQIEHIYIPNEYKEAYERFSGNFFQSRITYYNLADLEEYHYSFQSTNGNTYYVNDNTLSIDILESYITEMTEGNFAFTTTEALDTQYQTFLETKPETPSTTTDEEGFVDESEFIKGYQALGSIYYTSTKSLKDILKIASTYILQKDGIRTDETKEVSFLVDKDTLSTTVKVNGKIVSSTISKLHQLDAKDYGEFIYLQNVATFNGVLLYDTTLNTSKTPTEIYNYLLHEVTLAEEITPPDFKDFSLTTPSSVDINSSLIHTNGNKYRVNMECLSFDLSQGINLSNPEITLQQVMSPDDDKEDPTSDYAVKTITGIYLPDTLNARGIPTAINGSILTYKGTPYTEKSCIHMITSSNKNDGKNYEIMIGGSLPDSIWYEHKIPVTILEPTFQESYTVCSDGTILITIPLKNSLTKENLQTHIESFFKDILKATSTVTLSTLDLKKEGTYQGSSYSGGNIEIIVTNASSLHNSSESKPIDQSDLKKGYTALSSISFSSDLTPEKAAKVLADKILYYNGFPVDFEYTTKIQIRNNFISFEFLKGEEKVYSFGTTYQVIKNSPYTFISAISPYNTGILITNTQDAQVSTFMNEVMPLVKTTRTEYTSNVSLALKGNTKLEGIYQLPDSNFYEYDYTVMALSIPEEVTNSKASIEYGKDTPTQPFDPETPDKKDEKEDKKDNDILNDFKENFENNKAFKTMSIILGTILGLVFIYVIYLLAKKIYKWLKK